MRRLLTLLLALAPLAAPAPVAHARIDVDVRASLSAKAITKGGRSFVVVKVTGAYRRTKLVLLQERGSAGEWATVDRTTTGARVSSFRVRPAVGDHVYRSVVRIKGGKVHRSTPTTLTVLPRPRIIVTSVAWAAPDSWEPTTVSGRVRHLPAGSQVRVQRRLGGTWWSGESVGRLDASGEFSLAGLNGPGLQEYRVVATPRDTENLASATSRTFTPVPELAGPHLRPGASPTPVPARGARLRIDGRSGDDLTFDGSSDGRWDVYSPSGAHLVSRYGRYLRLPVSETGTFAVDRRPGETSAEDVRVVRTPTVTAELGGAAVSLPQAAPDQPRVLAVHVGQPRRYLTLPREDESCHLFADTSPSVATTTYSDPTGLPLLVETIGAGVRRFAATCPTTVRAVPAVRVTGNIDRSEVAWQTTSAGQAIVVDLPTQPSSTEIEAVVSAPTTSVKTQLVDVDTGARVSIRWGRSGRHPLVAGHAHVLVIQLAGDAVGSGTVTVGRAD